MPRGGARNRSGPQPDPESARSERLGYSLEALPADGYRGDPPEFPLPDPSDREMVLWREAWRTPQAWAWSRPDQRWRVRPVAMWVRLSARCEDPDAAASLLGQLHRFADQIGMTTAGLREMGWKIAPPSPESKAAPPDEVGQARQRRLRA